MQILSQTRGGLLTLTFPTHNVGRCRSQESEIGALQGSDNAALMSPLTKTGVSSVSSAH